MGCQLEAQTLLSLSAFGRFLVQGNRWAGFANLSVDLGSNKPLYDPSALILPRRGGGADGP